MTILRVLNSFLRYLLQSFLFERSDVSKIDGFWAGSVLSVFEERPKLWSFFLNSMILCCPVVATSIAVSDSMNKSCSVRQFSQFDNKFLGF